jgi:hypothetical protein
LHDVRHGPLQQQRYAAPLPVERALIAEVPESLLLLEVLVVGLGLLETPRGVALLHPFDHPVESPPHRVHFLGGDDHDDARRYNTPRLRNLSRNEGKRHLTQLSSTKRYSHARRFVELLS